MSNSFWKIGFIFLLLIFIVFVVGFGAFLLGRGSVSLDFLNQEKVVQEEETAAPALSSPSPTISVSEDKEKIKEAVFEKTGLNSEVADVTISDYSPKFAKGGIKEKEAIGGAYFIAAKVGDEWVCVYDGQAHPSCNLIEPYNFPVEMVSECMADNGTVVVR